MRAGQRRGWLEGSVKALIGPKSPRGVLAPDGSTLITYLSDAISMVMELKPPWAIQRSWLVKAEDETDPRYGWRPEERPLDEYLRLGVVNLDKPPGPTSHETTSWVKRILGVSKAGHGGTLEVARASLGAGEIPV